MMGDMLKNVNYFQCNSTDILKWFRVHTNDFVYNVLFTKD